MLAPVLFLSLTPLVLLLFFFVAAAWFNRSAPCLFSHYSLVQQRLALGFASFH